MNKHTPGPWQVTRLHGEPARAITNRDNVLVADCYPDTHEDLQLPQSYQANARLIAAAPDLLEVLKDITPEEYGCSKRHTFITAPDCQDCQIAQRARDAIAKAEGR